MGLLDGKVAIVTGAGGGIGRGYALRFAAEGARVVVNDLGGARDGTGASERLADQVVEEIRAAGGEAVANYDSVASYEGAGAIVQAALDAFGRLDILVNNAGILRDKTLRKMEEAMFDAVIAVHLKGTWNCAKHAALAMIEQGEGGRIINTSSIAGLRGNFGQTNYGAAKAGIWGMTLTLALELRRAGITANAIAPVAKTRLTDDIEAVSAELRAEDIAPVCLWLASDLAADVTGRTFGVHGRHLFEYRMTTTDGLEPAEPWTPEAIQAALPEIERGSGKGVPTRSEMREGEARPPTPAEIVAALAHDMPKGLRKEKAAGVSSVFHLSVEGAGEFTIRVEGGACTVEDGLQGEPSCRIRTDAESYLAMATGKLNPQQAFMQGKISADSLPEAMKYGALFRQPKPEEVKARIAALGAGTPAPAAALLGAPTTAPAVAPAPETDEAKLDRVFARMPEVFRPERVAGWAAAVVWEVAGAGSWTIHVADGSCRTEKGGADAPTCTVRLDAPTMLGIVSGSVNAQQAFMAGKVTADNLGDMMKFGQAFDLKRARKIREAAKASGAGAAPGSPAASTPAASTEAATEDPVAAAFRRLPEIFRADRAEGWTAALVWRIDGAGDFTVRVADGVCQAMPGPVSDATCTIRLAAETFRGLLTGEVDAQRAFMQGKVTADNLGDVMRFAKAFDLKRGGRLLQASASTASTAATADTAASAAAADGGLNRALIGKTWSGGAHFVRPDDARAYALACNDPNPHYLGDADPVLAPPLFPVRIMKDGLFLAVSDPELRCELLRVVHGEQDMRFLRPLRPWDLVTVRVKLESIEAKSSGELMTICTSCFVEGELACEARTGIFVRARGSVGKKEKAGGASAVDAGDGEAVRETAFSEEMDVAEDQPARYAVASLDDNPIHLSPEVAEAAGLPGVILQGLCTMAFAGRAVVERVLGGDPRRLRRLKVRFSKPVFPGQTLTTKGWKLGGEGGTEVYGFETHAADGASVITQGVAEIAVG